MHHLVFNIWHILILALIAIVLFGGGGWLSNLFGGPGGPDGGPGGPSPA
jgi:hypothetical protein